MMQRLSLFVTVQNHETLDPLLCWFAFPLCCFQHGHHHYQEIIQIVWQSKHCIHTRHSSHAEINCGCKKLLIKSL